MNFILCLVDKQIEIENDVVEASYVSNFRPCVKVTITYNRKYFILISFLDK